MNGLTFTLCLSAYYAYAYQEPTFEEVVVLYSEYPEEEGGASLLRLKSLYATQGSNPTPDQQTRGRRQACYSHVCASPWTPNPNPPL